jgi:hypothetical protein
MSMQDVQAILVEAEQEKPLAAVLGKHGGDRQSEKPPEQGDSYNLEQRAMSAMSKTRRKMYVPTPTTKLMKINCRSGGSCLSSATRVIQQAQALVDQV